MTVVVIGTALVPQLVAGPTLLLLMRTTMIAADLLVATAPVVMTTVVVPLLATFMSPVSGMDACHPVVVHQSTNMVLPVPATLRIHMRRVAPLPAVVTSLILMPTDMPVRTRVVLHPHAVAPGAPEEAVPATKRDIHPVAIGDYSPIRMISHALWNDAYIH
jgi:hypothetical protein